MAQEECSCPSCQQRLYQHCLSLTPKVRAEHKRRVEEGSRFRRRCKKLAWTQVLLIMLLGCFLPRALQPPQTLAAEVGTMPGSMQPPPKSPQSEIPQLPWPPQILNEEAKAGKLSVLKNKMAPWAAVQEQQVLASSPPPEEEGQDASATESTGMITARTLEKDNTIAEPPVADAEGEDSTSTPSSPQTHQDAADDGDDEEEDDEEESTPDEAFLLEGASSILVCPISFKHMTSAVIVRKRSLTRRKRWRNGSRDSRSRAR